MDASDDAIHCDGTVTITGGDLTLATADDAIHAETNVAITGGDISITTCYEGIDGAADARRLVDLGCELGQGSYYAGAQPGSMIDALVTHASAMTGGNRETPPPDPADDTATVVLPSLRRSVVAAEA